MLKKRSKGSGESSDDAGASLFEFALVIFVLFGLMFFVIQISWWWWSQMIAATAVHDGVRTAGARYGEVSDGYAVTYDQAYWALGRQNADELEAGTSFKQLWITRSVQGSLHVAQPFSTPFIGEAAGEIKVKSCQRDWQFYGGEPAFWE